MDNKVWDKLATLMTKGSTEMDQDDLREIIPYVVAMAKKSRSREWSTLKQMFGSSARSKEDVAYYSKKLLTAIVSKRDKRASRLLDNLVRSFVSATSESMIYESIAQFGEKLQSMNE